MRLLAHEVSKCPIRLVKVLYQVSASITDWETETIATNAWLTYFGSALQRFQVLLTKLCTKISRCSQAFAGYSSDVVRCCSLLFILKPSEVQLPAVQP